MIWMSTKNVSTLNRHEHCPVSFSTCRNGISRHKQGFIECREWPGTDVMISPKNLAKVLAFFPNYCMVLQKFYHNIGF
jgi:hypothetical protein